MHHLYSGAYMEPLMIPGLTDIQNLMLAAVTVSAAAYAFVKQCTVTMTALLLSLSGLFIALIL